MFHIFRSAGWPIWLLLVVSIICLALIIERFLALRRTRILPDGLLSRPIRRFKEGKMGEREVEQLSQDSPLGMVLAAGLRRADQPKEDIKESMEEAGHTAGLQMERFLTSIGTIAALAPLLGLFGTVVGMIEIFGAQNATGMNPTQLAHGISVALYNTGFGLLIAMPALACYRHFKAQTNNFLIQMETQASKLIDAILSSRHTE